MSDIFQPSPPAKNSEPVNYATQAEVEALSEENKIVSPKGLDYFRLWLQTQIVTFKGLILGTDTEPGATRTIEARGSAADVDVELKPKGSTGRLILPYATGIDPRIAFFDSVGKLQIGDPVASFTKISNYGNALFVSPTGNNETAVKGRLDRPYQTISSAYTNAASGDTIIMYGGTFNENVSSAVDKGSAGLTICFLCGATLNGSFVNYASFLTFVSDGTGKLIGNHSTIGGGYYSRYVGFDTIQGNITNYEVKILNTTRVVGAIYAYILEISRVKYFQDTTDTFVSLAQTEAVLRDIDYFEIKKTSSNGYPCYLDAERVRFKCTNYFVGDSRFGKNRFIDCQFKVTTPTYQLIYDNQTFQQQTFIRCLFDVPATALFLYTNPVRMDFHFNLYNAQEINSGTAFSEFNDSFNTYQSNFTLPY